MPQLMYNNSQNLCETSLVIRYQLKAIQELNVAKELNGVELTADKFKKHAN